MHILKHVFFLTLFLLFITFIAIADYSNAADRVRSNFDEAVTGYTQPYLNPAHPPNMSAWRQPNWSPERFERYSGELETVIGRLEDSGIIQGVSFDTNGLPVIEVGDLFLRLADSDKSKILKSLDHAMNPPQDRDLLAYAVQHKRTEQFLGLYTKNGLQLQ